MPRRADPDLDRCFPATFSLRDVDHSNIEYCAMLLSNGLSLDMRGAVRSKSEVVRLGAETLMAILTGNLSRLPLDVARALLVALRQAGADVSTLPGAAALIDRRPAREDGRSWAEYDRSVRLNFTRVKQARKTTTGNVAVRTQLDPVALRAFEVGARVLSERAHRMFAAALLVQFPELERECGDDGLPIVGGPGILVENDMLIGNEEIEEALASMHAHAAATASPFARARGKRARPFSRGGGQDAAESNVVAAAGPSAPPLPSGSASPSPSAASVVVIEADVAPEPAAPPVAQVEAEPAPPPSVSVSEPPAAQTSDAGRSSERRPRVGGAASVVAATRPPAAGSEGRHPSPSEPQSPPPASAPAPAAAAPSAPSAPAAPLLHFDAAGRLGGVGAPTDIDGESDAELVARARARTAALMARRRGAAPPSSPAAPPVAAEAPGPAADDTDDLPW